MGRDCTQFWFLKAPTPFCQLDTLAETSPFSRMEPHEDRARALFTRES